MRFHQFQNVRGGFVAIDLDAVWGVCPLGGDETTIYAGGGCFPVKGAVEDVLALISPPAAPDTYEEELRDRMDAIRAKVVDLPEAAAPYRCPDCGYPAGSLHDSGCWGSRGRNPVVEAPPEATSVNLRTVRRKARLYEVELMRSWAKAKLLWPPSYQFALTDYLDTRRKEIEREA